MERTGYHSCHIQSEDGASYHRNRQHIRPMPTPESPHQEDNDSANAGNNAQGLQEEMNAGLTNWIP